jgi:pimeloyl-ACP methyl ester carboxylesterase
VTGALPTLPIVWRTRAGLRAVTVAAATGVVALLLSGCASPGRASGPSDTSAYAAQRLSWKGCGQGESFQAGSAVRGEAECAHLSVPTDHAEPQRGEQRLAVARVRSRAQSTRGVLYFNVGGPGTPGTAVLADLVGALPAELRDSYDVVVMDPRGVGESGYVSCTDPQRRSAERPVDGSPEDADELRQLRAATARFGRSCLQRQASLTPHLGTTESARDLDLLRSALQVERLDLVGYSYGTLLAFEYARLFPDRVHRMVLDGVVVPGQAPPVAALEQARSAEDALHSFVAGCVAVGDCPLGSSEEAIVATIRDLQTHLDANPVRLRGALAADAVDDSAFTAVLLSALHSPDLASSLGDVVEGLRRGDAEAFQALVDQLLVAKTLPMRNVGDGVHAGTRCQDQPRSALRDEDRLSIELASPTFGTLLVADADLCSTWPVAPRPVPAATVEEVGPRTLVVGNAVDPATPQSGVDDVLRLLPGATRLDVDVWGHTAFLTGLDCVDGVVSDFLTRGETAAAAAGCGAD